jgi:hypothetical protein
MDLLNLEDDVPPEPQRQSAGDQLLSMLGSDLLSTDPGISAMLLHFQLRLLNTNSFVR